MNVFEVVKENVTARQAAEAYGLKVGRTGMACCPFHSDKSPSMKLDERYYCFGCGATGDAVDLTAKLFGIGLREAAVKLAEDFGLNYDRPKKARCPPSYSGAATGTEVSKRRKSLLQGADGLFSSS